MDNNSTADENDDEYTPSSDDDSDDDIKNVIEAEYVEKPPPQAEKLLPQTDNIAEHTRDKLNLKDVHIDKLDEILYQSLPDETPRPNIEYQMILRNMDLEESEDDEYEPEEDTENVVEDEHITLYPISEKHKHQTYKSKVNNIKILKPILPQKEIHTTRLFTDPRYSLLQHQIKIFFQLLVENFLLMLDNSDYDELLKQAKDILCDLRLLNEHFKSLFTSHHNQFHLSSVFQFPGVQYIPLLLSAFTTNHQNENLRNNNDKQTSQSYTTAYTTIHTRANSLFQYFAPSFNPSLYPNRIIEKPNEEGGYGSTGRLLFTPAEDRLLAIGEYYYMSEYDKISERLVPTMSASQLKNRSKNLRHSNSKVENNCSKECHSIIKSGRSYSLEEVLLFRAGIQKYNDSNKSYELIQKEFLPHLGVNTIKDLKKSLTENSSLLYNKSIQHQSDQNAVNYSIVHPNILLKSSEVLKKSTKKTKSSSNSGANNNSKTLPLIFFDHDNIDNDNTHLPPPPPSTIPHEIFEKDTIDEDDENDNNIELNNNNPNRMTRVIQPIINFHNNNNNITLYPQQQVQPLPQALTMPISTIPTRFTPLNIPSIMTSNNNNGINVTTTADNNNNNKTTKTKRKRKSKKDECNGDNNDGTNNNNDKSKRKRRKQNKSEPQQVSPPPPPQQQQPPQQINPIPSIISSNSKDNYSNHAIEPPPSLPSTPLLISSLSKTNTNSLNINTNSLFTTMSNNGFTLSNGLDSNFGSRFELSRFGDETLSMDQSNNTSSNHTPTINGTSSSSSSAATTFEPFFKVMHEFNGSTISPLSNTSKSLSLNSPNSTISSATTSPDKSTELNTLNLTNTQISTSSLSTDSLFKSQQGREERINLTAEDQLILQHVNTYGEKKWNLLTSKINKTVDEIINRHKFIKNKI